jgi:hypothetical protein
MKRKYFFWLVLITVAVLGLAACGPSSVTTEKIEPSRLEDIDGSELKRVILTEKAAERIGVQTVAVDGSFVPYSAVIYDTEGNTWVYTNPAPLTFVRAPILIDRIEGDQAFLSEQLDTAAPVVTIGVIEIYGAETGVSR